MNGKYMQLREDEVPSVYLPFTQKQSHIQRTVFVRTVGDPNALIRTVRHEMATLAPNLPYIDVQTMEQVLRPQVQSYHIAAVLLLIFGGTALALAGIGLYGLVAYLVTSKTSEIGVRAALGANTGRILRTVLWLGLRPTLLGVGLGWLGAVALAGLLRSQFYAVSPLDPVTLLGVVLILMATAVAACSIPAWRATKVGPIIALRTD